MHAKTEKNHGVSVEMWDNEYNGLMRFIVAIKSWKYNDRGAKCTCCQHGVGSVPGTLYPMHGKSEQNQNILLCNFYSHNNHILNQQMS